MSPEVARRVITLFRTYRPPHRAEYDLTPHEVRTEVAGRGTQLPVCGGGIGCYPKHGQFPPLENLRKDAGTLKNRSCRQGAPQSTHLIGMPDSMACTQQ